jgi:hypothetical protein
VTKRVECILSNEQVFVGLQDSKKTWKLCVRNGGVMVHETSMPDQYEVLRNYFHNEFPECHIKVMYESGFGGFNLHDWLEADGWECVVTPRHTVTQEKCQREKNDRTDCAVWLRIWRTGIIGVVLFQISGCETTDRYPGPTDKCKLTLPACATGSVGCCNFMDRIRPYLLDQGAAGLPMPG